MAARSVQIHLVSTSAYSSGRKQDDPLLPDEGDSAYDARTWRSKMTFIIQDGEKIAAIPARGFQMALIDTAKILVPELFDHFEDRVTVESDIALYAKVGQVLKPIRVNDVEPTRIHVSRDGRPGNVDRAWRMYPLIPTWEGAASVLIIAPEIESKTFERVVQLAGRVKGVGRSRPANGGQLGKFAVTKFDWATV